MQIALLLLVVAGSTAWLAMDASKRDWTGNSFARNVPSWVAGSLLLWPVIFPLYVFVHRKKAPLLNPPKAVPAAAMAASGPSERYGPSLDEVEREAVVEVVEVEPEPVVDVQRDPVVEVEPQPFAEVEPQPVLAPQAVAEHEPVVEPAPVAEVERESVVEVAPVESQPVAEPQPEPVVEPEVEPEVDPAPQPDPVLEISFPDVPAEEAPPGLSVDAFKDIKPVAFGGIAADETESASPVVSEPEPVVEVESEPAPVADFEPLSYPLETEPMIEMEPEPVVATTVTAPEIAAEPKPKKRGFGIPNPQLKLPSFGGKGGLKLPQITLPPNLQGPLTDLERKIALGSVVAIVAAAAFGYSTAPQDDAAAPPSAPAPAAASR